MMVELAQLPNPYDFANPVSDPNLFSGRSSEFEEIQYYLDQAVRTSRPINLALIGARASGKTSVLNMIEIEAARRGCCVVRVNLDEADAETQLAFFYKIFDALLTVACANGAYEGLGGRTYDTYCDIISTYEVPKEKLFCPFVFPIRYAKAISKGNYDAALPDTNFKRDIENIQRELNRPIVILFDECDVLSKSRVHLQKLRNIFMNTQGYMLTLTGTPALFPLIDEVFSPIVRQFKKITIGPFGEQEETKDCIRRPLETIGLVAEELMDVETYWDVNEIHDITGGRPYEIQLLCHSLFRRVQDGRAKQMHLTLDVLDDVLDELRANQDITIRPILNKVRDLDNRDLEALGKLCACNGLVTFDQIWFAEYTFSGEKSWGRTELEDTMHKLQDMKVLVINESGHISFSGDDFDRVYCKYFARKRGVALAINDLPYEILLAGVKLERFLRTRDPSEISPSSEIMFGELTVPDYYGVLELIQHGSSADLANSFAGSFDFLRQVYYASIENRHQDVFQVAVVDISALGGTARRWFRCRYPSRGQRCALDRLKETLHEVTKRAIEAGGKLDVVVLTFPGISIDIWSDVLKKLDNTRLNKQLAAWHYDKMLEAYLEQDDFDGALLHGELRYQLDRASDAANNLGYLHISRNDLDSASEFLSDAENHCESDFNTALVSYNLGVVDAKRGNHEGARVRFETAGTICENLPNSERICSALFRVNYSESLQELELVEVREDPDLLELARLSIQALSALDSVSNRNDGPDELHVGANNSV